MTPWGYQDQHLCAGSPRGQKPVQPQNDSASWRMDTETVHIKIKINPLFFMSFWVVPSQCLNNYVFMQLYLNVCVILDQIRCVCNLTLF